MRLYFSNNLIKVQNFLGKLLLRINFLLLDIVYFSKTLSNIHGIVLKTLFNITIFRLLAVLINLFQFITQEVCLRIFKKILQWICPCLLFLYSMMIYFLLKQVRHLYYILFLRFHVIYTFLLKYLV